MFGRIAGLPWPFVRIGAAVALAAVIPLLAIVTAMWALVIVAALLAATLVIEGLRPASARCTAGGAVGSL